MEEKTIRINKVLRDFNISLDQAVKFLELHNIKIQFSSNAKISITQYELFNNKFNRNVRKSQAKGIVLDSFKQEEVNTLQNQFEAKKVSKGNFKRLNERVDINEYVKLLKTQTIGFAGYEILLSEKNKDESIEKFSNLILDYIYSDYLLKSKQHTMDNKVRISVQKHDQVISSNFLNVNELAQKWTRIVESNNHLTYLYSGDQMSLAINEIRIHFEGGRFPASLRRLLTREDNGHLIQLFQDYLLFDALGTKDDITVKERLVTDSFFKCLLLRGDLFTRKSQYSKNDLIEKGIYEKILATTSGKTNHLFTNPVLNFDAAIHNISELKKKPLLCCWNFVKTSSQSTLGKNYSVLNQIRRVFKVLDSIIRQCDTKILFKVICDQENGVEVYSTFFETNHLFNSFTEFNAFAKKHDLSEGEIFAILLNADYLTNKKNDLNNIKLQNEITEIIYDREKMEVNNPFINDFKSVLQNDYASGKIKTIVKYGDIILESQFTDFQAFHICKGLKNHNFLYNKFRKFKHTAEDVLKAHICANNLLNDKGKVMIDFILSLPSLPFKCDNFKILFSTLDRIKFGGSIENPIIRLKIPNEKGLNDEVEFSFFAIDGKKYINQIIAVNKTKKSEVFIVNRDSTVLPRENNKNNGRNLNVTPILQFFYQITESADNFNNAILSYGIECGKCSVCGRVLIDEKSKLKGIGPVCARYI
ncbi:DUF6011 domain-containing protein [Flavobacterium sp.]|uniref:DUF6011 domain-containing protein n=1 Tax=Flavobacterium sp. TaxID=239 RepID=UPI003B9B80BE